MRKIMPVVLFLKWTHAPETQLRQRQLTSNNSMHSVLHTACMLVVSDRHLSTKGCTNRAHFSWAHAFFPPRPPVQTLMFKFPSSFSLKAGQHRNCIALPISMHIASVMPMSSRMRWPWTGILTEGTRMRTRSMWTSISSCHRWSRAIRSSMRILCPTVTARARREWALASHCGHCRLVGMTRSCTLGRSHAALQLHDDQQQHCKKGLDGLRLYWSSLHGETQDKANRHWWANNFVCVRINHRKVTVGAWHNWNMSVPMRIMTSVA